MVRWLLSLRGSGMACKLDLNEQRKTAKRIPEPRHPGRKSILKKTDMSKGKV